MERNGHLDKYTTVYNTPWALLQIKILVTSAVGLMPRRVSVGYTLLQDDVHTADWVTRGATQIARLLCRYPIDHILTLTSRYK